jgi:preprotein translocase subunit SecG
MENLLLVIHLIICMVLIVAILLQRSEGGALGIGGSGGGGGNLFSARGVGNGLTRLTAILAVAFFITSITLTILATRGTNPSGSVFEGQGENGGANGAVLPNLGQQPPEQPAAPAAPTNN